MGNTDRSSNRADTELLHAARDGDRAAFAALVDRWFDQVWNVSKSILRDSEPATTVTQEVFLSARRQLEALDPAEAFGPWVLKLSRKKALGALETQHRSTPLPEDIVGEWQGPNKSNSKELSNSLNSFDLSKPRALQRLAWATSAALGETDVSILDLHLRHGLNASDLADELDVPKTDAPQHLSQLRDRLSDAIGNYLLWKSGRPLCRQLEQGLTGAQVFSQSTNKAVQAHHAKCSACAAQHRRFVDPQRLFLAVPMFIVPSVLKARAIEGLRKAGINLDEGTADLPDLDTAKVAAISADRAQVGKVELSDQETTESSAIETGQTEPGSTAEADQNNSAADRSSEGKSEAFDSLESSAITERFKLLPPEEDENENKFFAEDTPVVHSGRRPRATDTKKPVSKLKADKRLAYAAAAIFLITAIGALVVLAGDDSGVSANSAPNPSETTTSDVGQNGQTIRTVDGSTADADDDQPTDTGNASGPLMKPSQDSDSNPNAESDPNSSAKPNSSSNNKAGSSSSPAAKPDSTNSGQSSTATTRRTTTTVKKPTTTRTPTTVRRTIATVDGSKIRVPSVDQLTTASGILRLRAAGLRAAITFVETDNPALHGYIRSSSPNPNTPVEKGSLVGLFVYQSSRN